MSSSLSKMHEVRDKDGYPLSGVDVVPERPKLPLFVDLLREANEKALRMEESSQYWHKRYHDLNREYMALKFANLCADCQKAEDTVKSSK